jgi:hypothetical protein
MGSTTDRNRNGAGKGDADRIAKFIDYTERNDSINWPGRTAKKQAEARRRKSTQGKK